MNCRFSVGAEQSAFYYPYGMPYADLNGYDRYKYSGKEIETANGLNHYDFMLAVTTLPLGSSLVRTKRLLTMPPFPHTPTAPPTQ